MRRILISEQFGLYKVESDGWQSTGASLESALSKAYAKATASLPRPGLPSPQEPAFDDLTVVDVLEVLLGRDRQSGQLHEGVQSG